MEICKLDKRGQLLLSVRNKERLYLECNSIDGVCVLFNDQGCRFTKNPKTILMKYRIALIGKIVY